MHFKNISFLFAILLGKLLPIANVLHFVVLSASSIMWLHTYTQKETDFCTSRVQ